MILQATFKNSADGTNPLSADLWNCRNISVSGFCLLSEYTHASELYKLHPTLHHVYHDVDLQKRYLNE